MIVPKEENSEPNFLQGLPGEVQKRVATLAAAAASEERNVKTLVVYAPGAVH
jgi:hypothetical protein